jgi:hypothetical protein
MCTIYECCNERFLHLGTAPPRDYFSVAIWRRPGSRRPATRCSDPASPTRAAPSALPRKSAPARTSACRSRSVLVFDALAQHIRGAAIVLAETAVKRPQARLRGGAVSITAGCALPMALQAMSTAGHPKSRAPSASHFAIPCHEFHDNLPMRSIAAKVGSTAGGFRRFDLAISPALPVIRA